ncbi:hypothetical protein BC829DRAFT_448945 [Chytridium lagenaria]|nr:hypothetical protein BC829DRAFT_448945 [Chytridium lagenaria]
MLFSLKKSFALLSLLSSAVVHAAPILERRQAPGDLEQLAKTFAPLMRFHPQEQYFSTSVEYFLSRAYLKDDAGNRIPDQPALTLSNLDFLQRTRNTDDSGTWISVDGNLDADPNLAPEMRFLEGSRNMNGVPMYAVVVPKANGVVDIFYLGKSTPLGRVGNHVGDWERFVVRTINGRAVSFDFHAHGSAGVRVVPANDRRVQFVGTHPVVYVALGSHGSWPQTGRNTYKTVALVYDLVDEAAGWRYKGFNPQFTGDLSWINYRGKYGNKGVNDCWFYDLTDTCKLGGGPSSLYRPSLLEAPPGQILATPGGDRSTVSFFLDASTRANAPGGFGFVAVHIYCPGTEIFGDSGDVERWGVVPLKPSNDLAYTITTDRCRTGRSRRVDRYEVAFCTSSDQNSCSRRSGYRTIRVFNNGAQTEALGVNVSDVDPWRF